MANSTGVRSLERSRMPRIAVLGVCAHVPPIASREHRSRKMDRFIIDRCDQSVLHSKGTYSPESCNTLGIFFSSQLQTGGLYERKGEFFTEGEGTASTGIEEGLYQAKRNSLSDGASSVAEAVLRERHRSSPLAICGYSSEWLRVLHPTSYGSSPRLLLTEDHFLQRYFGEGREGSARLDLGVGSDETRH